MQRAVHARRALKIRAIAKLAVSSRMSNIKLDSMRQTNSERKAALWSPFFFAIKYAYFSLLITPVLCLPSCLIVFIHHVCSPSSITPVHSCLSSLFSVFFRALAVVSAFFARDFRMYAQSRLSSIQKRLFWRVLNARCTYERKSEAHHATNRSIRMIHLLQTCIQTQISSKNLRFHCNNDNKRRKRRKPYSKTLETERIIHARCPRIVVRWRRNAHRYL